MSTHEINEALAQKVLALLEHGLVRGLGAPEPGKMCVEAAVNYAMGADHGDNPACVAQSLRRLKIKLNDASWSSSRARADGLRRLAIVQLGSAGALDEREFVKRVSRLSIQVAVPQALRAAASICKNSEHKDSLLHWADTCERDPTRANARGASAAYAAADAADAYAAADAAADAADAVAYADAAAYAAHAAVYAADAAAYAADAAAYAAYAAADAADAAYAAARDKSLAVFCEAVVQILIDMNVPGAKFLHLAPLKVAMGVVA